MQRTQILLEEWQYERLKVMAEGQGKSLSGLVRELLTPRLRPASSRPGGGLRAIEGAGADATATGRRHDRWLYGARRRA